jgi:TonB family protein
MFGMLVTIAAQAVQPVQPVPSTAVPRAPQLLSARTQPDDYPVESMGDSEWGVVSTLLRVSATGRVIGCVVTESSGYDTLDKGTCRMLRLRARFDPARDEAGKPVEGEYRMANAWSVVAHQARTTIEVPLEVRAVPRDYRAPVHARIVFDATGHVTACDVTATSGSAGADRAACTHIREKLVIPAPKAAAAVEPVAVRYLVAALAAK